MKFAIKAGGEIDVLTKDEVSEVVADAMKAWRAELARGPKWLHRAVRLETAGAGTWEVTPDRSPNSDPLGPREGFIWSVTRIGVNGPAFLIATPDTWSAFVDDIGEPKRVASPRTADLQIDPGSLVVNAGSQLALSGTNAAAGELWVTVSAIELPVQLGWMLV